MSFDQSSLISPSNAATFEQLDQGLYTTSNNTQNGLLNQEDTEKNRLNEMPTSEINVTKADETALQVNSLILYQTGSRCLI